MQQYKTEEEAHDAFMNAANKAQINHNDMVLSVDNINLHEKDYKVVYVAHPIAGDVEGNLLKIEAVVSEINRNYTNVVPLVPYYADCKVLDDKDPVDRSRGIRNSYVLFYRRFIDELWLYGDRISSGMWDEIKICRELGIRIVPQSKATHKAFFNPARIHTNLTRTLNEF